MMPLPTHPIKLSFAIYLKNKKSTEEHIFLLLSTLHPPFPLLSNSGKVFKCPTGRRKIQKEGKEVTIIVRISSHDSSKKYCYLSLHTL